MAQRTLVHGANRSQALVHLHPDDSARGRCVDPSVNVAAHPLHHPADKPLQVFLRARKDSNFRLSVP